VQERIATLAAPELGGRAPGSPGLESARKAVLEWMKSAGLEAGGEGGSWEQTFGPKDLPHGATLRTEEAHLPKGASWDDVEFVNLVGVLPGKGGSGAHGGAESVVIGAHLDHLGTNDGGEVFTGADDNASGVAAMLELARRFAGSPMDRTVRWVGYTNEENSNSAGGLMGSFVSARNAQNRNEKIVAMMSLEMLGYYDETPGSQRYPFDQAMAARLGMDLPDTGDYIGVVGRFEDRGLIDAIAASMRSSERANVVAAALPAMVSAIWRSDHGNYWLAGYNAVMITDTSEFRTPHYHMPSDTIDTLDFDRMAGVVDALEVAVRDLATAEAE